jgi:hypothetical protein
MRGLEMLLEHVARHRSAVWAARRADIARHWLARGGDQG